MNAQQIVGPDFVVTSFESNAYRTWASGYDRVTGRAICIDYSTPEQLARRAALNAHDQEDA